VFGRERFEVRNQLRSNRPINYISDLLGTIEKEFAMACPLENRCNVQVGVGLQKKEGTSLIRSNGSLPKA
jgi:hypothetical protein